ncbi:MAG: DeoR family transcriptional regulator [Alphaproteobacteria bacterium]|nr:MAG: DeoR family transcriptional regulator [Alphaproteobacteria bacterium]
MYLTPRQAQIVELAKSRGRVMVEQLAQTFGMTPQTIRRDLNDLCNNGQLVRIHGGALYPTTNENLEYEQRRMIAAEAKQAIGEATARLIPDNSSLFINIGTTTEAVAKALLVRNGLLVITNNINVANILRESPSIEVILSGGVVRHSDGALVGETAVDFFNRFKVDYAIIGTSAIDASGALLDFDLREVSVAQAIMANAAHIILVTDATKFDRRAPMRIADISRIDTFVTDHCPLPGFRQLLNEYKVRLLETRP